jgi:hypothetical protein
VSLNFIVKFGQTWDTVSNIWSPLDRNTTLQVMWKRVQINICAIWRNVFWWLWAGYLSRYSEWLRAGRSWDRIPVVGEIFRICLDRSWGPSSLLYSAYRVFPGGKERPGRDADPSAASSAVGHERVEPYLYSPYGPYGLYRASVHVQGWPLPYLYSDG